MNDLLLLKILIYFSCFIAPRISYYLFLSSFPSYLKIHNIIFALLIIGEFLNQNYFACLWPLFCLYGFYLIFKKLELKKLDWNQLSQVVPFFFSLVAATWLVAGTFDLRLLGYDAVWSFLAAAHGNFLGWILISFFAYLSTNLSRFNKLFATGSFLSGICFLLIALGINGMPYVKLIGVFSLVGITFSLLTLYLITFNKNFTASKCFLLIGITTLIFTFTISLLNEFSLPLFDTNLHVSNMLMIHGGLNALVVIPSLFLSIYLRFK